MNSLGKVRMIILIALACSAWVSISCSDDDSKDDDGDTSDTGTGTDGDTDTDTDTDADTDTDTNADAGPPVSACVQQGGTCRQGLLGGGCQDDEMYDLTANCSRPLQESCCMPYTADPNTDCAKQGGTCRTLGDCKDDEVGQRPISCNQLTMTCCMPTTPCEPSAGVCRELVNGATCPMGEAVSNLYTCTAENNLCCVPSDLCARNGGVCVSETVGCGDAGVVLDKFVCERDGRVCCEVPSADGGV